MIPLALTSICYAPWADIRRRFWKSRCRICSPISQIYKNPGGVMLGLVDRMFVAPVPVSRMLGLVGGMLALVGGILG